jgi:hypothetical protein
MGGIFIKVLGAIKMKTLTIKREMVESLDSVESKLEFADVAIALLTDREPTKGMTGEVLQEGLNDDLPEQIEGSPEFDSSNMGAAEFKRFSMVRAGFFPVHLNCGYADYRYKHWDDYSEDDLADMFSDVGIKGSRNKGKKNFVAFLNYIQDVLLWYRRRA